MKYAILGAGGVGGCLAAYLQQAGKEVTLYARGAHLEAIRRSGLYVEQSTKPSFTAQVHAIPVGEETTNPDVIFVCVKGYSLAEVLPDLQRISTAKIIVIPILNIYGTGGRLQKELAADVLDGCVYIAGERTAPGRLLMKGDIFTVVFGHRDHTVNAALQTIADDLEDSGIHAVLSTQVQKDTYEKYTYISPAATCGLFYHATAGMMQKDGEIRETFKTLVKETEQLAAAMGIALDHDMVQKNLAILDSLAPEASTSMQRDIAQGRRSEIEGLVYEPVRLAEKFGITLPTYQKIADRIALKGQ